MVQITVACAGLPILWEPWPYGTESSTCMTAGWMAWKTAIGQPGCRICQTVTCFLAGHFNPYYSVSKGSGSRKSKSRGMKVIVVDPKITPTTEKMCDLHLRPYPGTDGALALCMGNILIQKGWIDKEYIDKYVHGFLKNMPSMQRDLMRPM